MKTPKAIELRSGETLQHEIKGDYWEKGLLGYSQNRGYIWLTNERIHVEAGFAKIIDIDLKDIVALKKCNISLFIPTGVDVVTHEDKTYRLSILKREEQIQKIESLMNAQK